MKTDPAQLRRYAHRYAAAGFGVLPLVVDGKEPDGRLAPNGLKNATTDTKLIDSWLDAGWTGNLGILPPKGYIVFDLDGSAGVDDFRKLTQTHGALPLTRTQRTAIGYHKLYKHDGPALSISKKLLGVQNIDLRGEGLAYIVAAPSWHPSGCLYKWLVEEPYPSAISTLPQPYVDLLTPPQVELIPVAPRDYLGGGDGSAYGLRALSDEANNIRTCGPGNRNHRLNASAFAIGQLIAGGELDEEYAANELMIAALECGLPQFEANRTLQSGIAAGQQTPRSATEEPIILLSWEKEKP
jgi:hypothetical protein